MINSMTGYGQSEGQVDGVSYAVEIKTVNNRYLKTIIKLPEAVAFLEQNIEKLLRTHLARGTVNYVLRLRNATAEVLFDIDETALKTFADKLERVVSSSGISASIDVASLLSLPGILVPPMPDEQLAQKIKDAVLNITEQALDKLKQMRAAEGAALDEDLKSNCDTIEEHLERIYARSSEVPQEYSKKLRKKIDDLLAAANVQLDEETLAREVAVFAERSDIAEEISRLRSHLQQFTNSCQGSGEAGRRLDFISQEMLREVNTIASKACDDEVAHLVIDMKCRIDRIKEQVQNVE
jgi:uncharacterized protein (TIGR00255 family)